MKLILTGIILSSLSLFDLQMSDSNQFSEYINTCESVNMSQEKQVLSFSSSVRYGKQANQLSLLISTDFDGNYDIESIKKATWQNLSKKSVKLARGEEFENSGAIDISNLVKDKPFYIAFKYIGEASTDGKPTQRTWQVKDAKLSDTGIKNFNIVNSPTNGEKVGWVKTQNGLIYRPSATLIASEGWAISNKLHF